MGPRTRSGVRQEIFLDVVAVGLEQHAGAAKLTNLLFRQLGHLALLLPQHESAREGVRPAKMLVRALKMLDYFLSETTSRGIATAALDQPGDEGCAYDRAQ